MQVERVDDPADSRLADYRELTDAVARRRIEGDELFVAEGPTSLERLLASGHRVRSVLVTTKKLDRLSSTLGDIPAPVFVVEPDTMREIAGFDLHRGVIAAADRRPQPSLDELLRTTQRIAVLEGLNDPENLGAVARSARAFGVQGLVLDPTCIDPYTRRTVRVSMGEILLLPWWRATPEEWPAKTFDALAEAGFESWAATPSGSDDLFRLPAPARLAVVLGAEGPGLQPNTLTAASRRVRIPIAPDVDSLNVAAAAAVAFAVTRRADG